MMTCSHRPPCQACPRFAEPGISPAAEFVLQELARRYELPEVAVIGGHAYGFRLRARLAIRGRLGSAKIGLFEPGTHRVVHIPHCAVHHPLINRVAAVVRSALADARITCYSDDAHLGLARYLQVVIERSSQTAQVVLVGNSIGIEPLLACLDLIQERLAEQLHSLWFSSNVGHSNTILGTDVCHVSGPLSVIERFAGTDIHYPPGAFGQSNLEVAQQIIECLGSQIAPGARVAEFYAGVGAIGLSLLKRVNRITMNEVNTHSLQGLQRGLDALDSADRDKVTVIRGTAGSACAAVAEADTVIVDPPRKGLDRALTQYLSEQPAQRLFYVSCGLDSLQRDLEQLIAPGRLRLTGLTAFNLLPFTEHVETLARLERI